MSASHRTHISPDWLGLALVALLAACAEPQPDPPLTAEQLRDPNACATCHPQHVEQWAGSMHALASDDPVFRALNARGQRESGGKLGTFCVKCHAPVAVALGLTKDGLDLDQLPASVQGVTCWFCHSVDAVQGTHNNPLRLANDGAMRGGLPDAVATPAHGNVYSPLHDRNRMESASLCGSCHDVVAPNGLVVEKTFVEWQSSLFAASDALRTQTGKFGARLTCGGCHMTGKDDVAATVPGSPKRRIHDHAVPAIDVALTPRPDKALRHAAVVAELATTLQAKLCIKGPKAEVTLDNVGAGHAFPSGVSAHRRIWLEVKALQGGQPVFSSGVVQDGQRLDQLKDPNLWELRSWLHDAAGKETHFAWQATSQITHVLEAPPPPGVDPASTAHARTRAYVLPPGTDEVSIRLRVRPQGLDMLDELIASGDLDPAVRQAMPTFDVPSTVLRWQAGGPACVTK